MKKSLSFLLTLILTTQVAVSDGLGQIQCLAPMSETGKSALETQTAQMGPKQQKRFRHILNSNKIPLDMVESYTFSTDQLFLMLKTKSGQILVYLTNDDFIMNIPLSQKESTLKQYSFYEEQKVEPTKGDKFLKWLGDLGGWMHSFRRWIGGAVLLATVLVLRYRFGRESKEAVDFLLNNPLWIGVAVLLSAGLLIYRWHARLRNREWLESKAFKNMEEIQHAYEEKNASLLDQIGQSIRERNRSTETLIVEAVQAKKKEIGDSRMTPLNQAKRFLAYDQLAAVLADLNENEVSDQMESRFAGKRFTTWKSETQEAEKTAVSSGSEVGVLRLLRALNEELWSQLGIVSTFKEMIESFRSVMPAFFSVDMQSSLAKANHALNSFLGVEMELESDLFRHTNREMRGRIDKKLYGRNPEYKQNRDRRDSLAELKQNHVDPGVSMVHDIESDLESVIQNRQIQSYNEMIALSKKAVPVTKSETVSDGQGGTRTRTWVEIEDQSGPYEALAAFHASQAQSSASSANQGFKRLKVQLGRMSADPVFKKEDLAKYLPHVNLSELDEGEGFLESFFMPDIFSFFSALSSIDDANSLLEKLAPLTRGVEKIQNEVDGRINDLHSWLERKITEDLLTQMGEMPGYNPKTFKSEWGKDQGKEPKRILNAQFDSTKTHRLVVTYADRTQATFDLDLLNEDPSLKKIIHEDFSKAYRMLQKAS